MKGGCLKSLLACYSDNNYKKPFKVVSAEKFSYQMRSIITCIFLFFFLLTYSQSADEIRNKDIIARNKVKRQISWDYKYTGDVPGKTGVKTSVTTYSSTGDVLEVNTYNSNGQVLNVEKYNYDSRGNKIEYSRNSSSSSYQKKWIYNNKNLLAEESGFDGLEDFRNVYLYNESDEMKEIQYMRKSGVREKRVFIKNGNVTTVSIYNSGGALTSQLVLKYDPKGNLIEEVIYGINKNELEKKTYQYDDKKNLKAEAKYKLDKITLRTTYAYNSSGLPVETAEEIPGVSKFIKKSQTYDEKGNLTQIKWRKKGDEDFNTLTYQYDAKGLCNSADTHYPATKYRVLTKYTYEYY